MAAKKKKKSSKQQTKKNAASRGRRSTRGGGDHPKCRTCATDQVHERLLRQSPGYAEGRAAVENHCWRAMRSPMVGRTGCTVIPVVVHVVHNTATQNISREQIDSQLAVLNADFRKRNADAGGVPAPFAPAAADARIEFELASEDPDGNPTNGIVRQSTTKSFFTDDDDMKFRARGGSDAWPRDRYLNIWVCQLGGGLLGYAQFPGGPADTDGVVVLHSAFGTEGTAAAPFDQGRTTTHEIGHWLNLRHIWGDDGTGCSGSDFVADTPNQGGPNTGKPAFPSESCGNGPHGDMFMNYMDYVDDDSMFMFTAGQVARMQATLDGARSSIGTSKPCEPVIAKPPADVPATLPPVTLKFIDDPPGTLKFFDDPGTLKFFDDSGSLKFFDDGTNPVFDPIKQPGLDKPPFSDADPFGLGGPFWRGQAGASPFVLSTPHHSNAWAASYPGAAQSRAAALQQRLQQLQAEYQRLQAEFADLGGSAG